MRIVSLATAIKALREYALSDLEDLVGPILDMIGDASEEEASPCKRHRTRSDEESGKDRSLSDDEPHDNIGDAVGVCAVEREAPESGGDEPWDGITDVLPVLPTPLLNTVCIGAWMCCMASHSGMFSGHTWRWVSQHVQARRSACCFHSGMLGCLSRRWLPLAACTGPTVCMLFTQWYAQLPATALAAPACTGPTICMVMHRACSDA